MEVTMWNEPTSRDVGLFSDLSLFAETLNLASERGAITISVLETELEQRVRGRATVRNPSKRVSYQLLRELQDFNWLHSEEASKKNAKSTSYVLSPAGNAARSMWRTDRRAFRRLLVGQMHRLYVVPGWIVDRLWRINPDGQGEIIIPAPLREWKPKSKPWIDNAWTPELEDQASRSCANAKSVSKGAFPVGDVAWVKAVTEAWTRLSTLEPKNRQAEVYRPRHRLTLAMHEGAIKLLFDRCPYGISHADFPGTRLPTPPRYFRAWCPRLMALEFLVYTDTHPDVQGRLIFPTGAFRPTAPAERFEAIEDVRHPDGRLLWLHLSIATRK